MSKHPQDRVEASAPAPAALPAIASWKIVTATVVAVFAVGGVGVAIGRATVPVVNQPGADADPVAAARSVVEAAYMNKSNSAFSGDDMLKLEDLSALLDEYERDPAAWDDQFLTPEIMAALKTLRDADVGGEEVTSPPEESAGRMRIRRSLTTTTYPSLAREAWKEIRSPDTTYANGVVDGNDRVGVFRKNDKCWIIGDESNDVGDWIDNLDIGSDDILSMKATLVQDESCGCARHRLWWCARYKTCAAHRVIGRGLDGFAKPLNRMRLAVWEKIQTTCLDSDVKVFAGYSRGGGLIAMLAFMVRADDLIPADKMALVTYGAPRTLADRESDWIHGQFPQYRIVYNDDVVPTLPFGWMGFKHYGTNICERGCGRDQPTFSLRPVSGILDHMQGYDKAYL